jgi:putative redox protein
MEMMLMGMGGCAAFDVVHILQKGRQAVTDCVAELQADRVDAVPAVFEKVHIHFKVAGDGLSEKQVSRAVALSAEKYCSASIMLERAGVQITHSHEIVDAAQRDE